MPKQLTPGISMTTATESKPIRHIGKPATRTTLAKVGHTDARWYVVDAAGKTLGRLASEIAVRLMGKHKAIYTAHIDTGDYIIVLNSAQIKVSGRKLDQREYDWYTNYPGGRGVVTMKDLLARKPNLIVEMAVRRMLPKTKLGSQMLKKLKVFKDDKHPFAAQKPEKLELL
jgi:large subunit ribosomal protein L13